MARFFALLPMAGVLARVACAASPHLANIDPPGIQRGADTDVVVTGDRLQDGQGMLFYTPGITVTAMKADGGKLDVRLHAAPDCPLGEHDVRVWTATGISELIPLYVGPFPNIACSGSNHSVAHAQPVALNTTVNGVIRDEEIDYYSVQLKKGDRLTAEVEGMRLGRDMFDPWAAILDAHGKQLAANDDNALFRQDPLVSTVALTDGTYVVSVRDSAWGGSDKSFYRMHIGTYPQPVAVYPSGGKAGDVMPVAYLGNGEKFATVQLPKAAEVPFNGEDNDHGLPAPAGLPMRVSDFPNVLEQKPNGDLAHATVAQMAPPLAFNGVIQHPGDHDFFRFHATKGMALDLTVYARQLRSPLDSVLNLWDGKGKHIAGNDDSNGPDSYLRFNVPADGDYSVAIWDQLERGGPTFVYRLEVVPVVPSISFTEPEVVKYSQERQTIVVPRGNRYATMLRTKREGIDDFRLAVPGLPPGVTLQTGSLAGDLMPVVFSAMPDAALTGTLTDVLAQSADGKQLKSGYDQSLDLVIGPPNQSVYLTTELQKLAVSVAEEAPFRLDVTLPPVPILQDGQAQLHVTATRAPGFTGPINVSMLYNPPGINSQATVTIPANQNSVDIPLNANGDAKAKTWQIAVIGSGDAGKGAVWVSSDLVPLTVAKPFVVGHIDRANVVQGQPVAVTCHLDQNVPFDGKAHIKLFGLPTKVTAPDMDVTAADKQVVFNVATDRTSPAGQHRDLFCEITIEKNGTKMTATTANGGVLRIDRPVAPAAPAPTPAVAASASPTAAPKEVAVK
jgi:hypothetical protein